MSQCHSSRRHLTPGVADTCDGRGIVRGLATRTCSDILNRTEGVLRLDPAVRMLIADEGVLMFMRCSPAGREQGRIAGGMAASSSSSSRTHQAKIVGGKWSGMSWIAEPPFTRGSLCQFKCDPPPPNVVVKSTTRRSRPELPLVMYGTPYSSYFSKKTTCPGADLRRSSARVRGVHMNYKTLTTAVVLLVHSAQ